MQISFYLNFLYLKTHPLTGRYEDCYISSQQVGDIFKAILNDSKLLVLA